MTETNDNRSSGKKVSQTNSRTRKYDGTSAKTSSRQGSTKRSTNKISQMRSSSHRSKKSVITKNSLNDDVKNQTSSHRSKMPKNSKTSTTRDVNNSNKETRRQLLAKELILSSYLKSISFKQVTVGKFWKREKLCNRILVCPKIGLNPVGISGKLIQNIKETLYKCDSDSIPNLYQLDGIQKSGCLLFYDYSTTENDNVKTNLMITNPNSEETTGISQNSLLDLKGNVTYIPEFRMESMKSPERNREYYITKINMF